MDPILMEKVIAALTVSIFAVLAAGLALVLYALWRKR